MIFSFPATLSPYVFFSGGGGRGWGSTKNLQEVGINGLVCTDSVQCTLMYVHVLSMRSLWSFNAAPGLSYLLKEMKQMERPGAACEV